MADLSDVLVQLQTLAVQAVYPTGTGNPSVAGVLIQVLPGWPIPQSLDRDLAAGSVQVSIFPADGERNTTRYPKDWQPFNIPASTITATIAGQTVVIAGAVTAGVPTNVCIEANGLAYVYAVQAADTPTSIATALAVLIPGASSSGGTVSLPNAARITAARVGVTGTSSREIRRQQRMFTLTVWAPTPALRDAVSQPIDALLAGLSFIVMPDTYAARLIYHGTRMVDGQEKANLYRRDLTYSVEYATTETVGATQITQQQISVQQINAPTTTYNL
jgi:hypothetical protein